MQHNIISEVRRANMTAARTDKETADQNEKLLGLVATIVESWKLLLIVPLLVGALAYLSLAARPSLYRSEAVLRLSKDEVVILKSGRVFGAAVKKLGGSDSRETVASVAVTSASASVPAAALDSSDDYTVAVTYNSAAGAASILQEMIDKLSAETMPSEFDRTRLESRIKVLDEAQGNIVKSIAKANETYDRAVQGKSTSDFLDFAGQHGQSVAQLTEVLAQNDEAIAAAKAELQPTFRPDDVIQPPSTPSIAVARSISPFATLMLVLSFGLLLVFVLVRDALRKETDSPNLTRVRRMLLPRTRP